jgi:hypothetical protein
VAGATSHAEWLWDVEQRLHLPSELSLQHLVLPHPLVVQFFNGYYAVMHVPALGALLIWLFARHRNDYPWVRNTLALLTFSCLMVQMIPMAPPRLLPGLGFVDTGLLYHQSVYGTGGSGISNQLAAMPSLHVGWALLVGVAAVRISRSPWRWLVVVHPVLTILSVTATANHWWLDGVVAGGLMVLAMGVQAAVRPAANRLRGALPVPISTPAPVAGASTLLD